MGDSNSATAQSLSELVFLGRGLSGPCNIPTWVNLTCDVLLAGLGRVLEPPANFVIEILENVDAAPDVTSECRGLRASGYKVALDDVVGVPRIESYAGHFDIVKGYCQDSG